MKNRKREICTSGTVRDEGGNILIYSAARWRGGSLAAGGAGEQRRRYVNAQEPGGLHVDDELELGWLYHRQIRRLIPLEDAADIHAGLAK